MESDEILACLESVSSNFGLHAPSTAWASSFQLHAREGIPALRRLRDPCNERFEFHCDIPTTLRPRSHFFEPVVFQSSMSYDP